MQRISIVQYIIFPLFLHVIVELKRRELESLRYACMMISHQEVHGGAVVPKEKTDLFVREILRVLSG